MRTKNRYFLVEKEHVTVCEDKAQVAAALAKWNADDKENAPDFVLVSGSEVAFHVETNPRVVFGEPRAKASRAKKSVEVSTADVSKVSAAIATVPRKLSEIVAETKLSPEVVSSVLARAENVARSGKGKGRKYLRVAASASTAAAPA